MSQAETKERILDAAERLFSEQGIDDTSLRAITGAAEANLAGVNYHFGSKEGLIEAVFARRFAPLNAARLKRLDELEAASDQAALEDLLDAFLRPAFRLSSDPEASSFCSRLMGRLQTETNPIYRSLCEAQFKEVAERFFPAIAQACPQLDPATAAWRIQFLIGALGYTMADFFDLQKFSGGLCDPHDSETATRRLIEFAAAGLRAPSTAGAPIETEVPR